MKSILLTLLISLCGCQTIMDEYNKQMALLCTYDGAYSKGVEHAEGQEGSQASTTLTNCNSASMANALKGYNEDVYVHTGVIFGTVDDPSDWRFVQGNWGKADERMKMKRIEEDLYQIQYQIRNFYGFSDQDPFLQMAFVFRNKDGSLIAKEKDEKDIFYPKYIN